MMLIQNKKIAQMKQRDPHAGEFYVSEEEWEAIVKNKMQTKYNIIRRSVDLKSPKKSTVQVTDFINAKVKQVEQHEQQTENKPKGRPKSKQE